MGDVAMLQIAVSRLGELLPGASILVFTESPAALARHCPGVEAVPHAGRLMWSAHDGVLAPLRRQGPQAPGLRPLAEAQLLSCQVRVTCLEPRSSCAPAARPRHRA